MKLAVGLLSLLINLTINANLTKRTVTFSFILKNEEPSLLFVVWVEVVLAFIIQNPPFLKALSIKHNLYSIPLPFQLANLLLI